VEFLGSFKYRIISSANRNDLTSSFPISIPFIYFSSFIVLARSSNTILNKSGQSRHPCLIPDFRVYGFSFPPLNMMLIIGLSYMAFTILSYAPSNPSFFRAFIMKGW
jgi:hypothetical protein